MCCLNIKTNYYSIQPKTPQHKQTQKVERINKKPVKTLQKYAANKTAAKEEFLVNTFKPVA